MSLVYCSRGNQLDYRKYLYGFKKSTNTIYYYNFCVLISATYQRKSRKKYNALILRYTSFYGVAKKVSLRENKITVKAGDTKLDLNRVTPDTYLNFVE